ncbi:hypothetical protein FSP39_013246 [Pinctada imbricata]|uniref:Uncharacterized protein n=1 Tax=Pinctada imbricata TaxID=66713 RepID=A0AA88Y517_PINIB|nr:hypothetical protein FSP39_013246 [Pinctada imbricata]
MATHTPRKVKRVVTTTTTRFTGSGDETPSTSGVSPGRRLRSPSPARATRQEEKEQLQNLNDRLAAYIDKVRYLETENSRLQLVVSSVEETRTEEVSSIKSMYENELADARRLLDETSKEKAKLQIEIGKYKADADDWKSKYLKRDREARDLEATTKNLEKENAELQLRAAEAEAQKKPLEKEINKLRGELATLQRQLDHAKKQLEEETLLRVDLQNRLQSLKEELQFKTQVHEQEMNEVRTRTTTRIEEVDAARRDEYDAKMADLLQQTREEYDGKILEVKQEVELLYETKVGDLQSALDRTINSSSISGEDLRITRRRADELSSELSKLKAMNASLEARVSELEAQLAREQEEYFERMGLRDKEISDLRATLEEQTQEYADLLEIKIKLDNEITVYRKLLETEEERLNMSQSSSPGSAVKSGRKRKRVALSETVQEYGESHSSSGFSEQSSATGSIVVDEIDPNGSFIKLHNTSDEDVTIGSWQLILLHSQDDGAEEKGSYKFHSRLNLKAGQFCTVWSSGSEQTHSPPSDLVMKGSKWLSNKDCMVATLLNSDHEEVARKSMTRSVQRTSTTTYRSLRGSDYPDTGINQRSISRKDGEKRIFAYVTPILGMVAQSANWNRIDEIRASCYRARGCHCDKLQKKKNQDIRHAFDIVQAFVEKEIEVTKVEMKREWVTTRLQNVLFSSPRRS